MAKKYKITVDNGHGSCHSEIITVKDNATIHEIDSIAYNMCVENGQMHSEDYKAYPNINDYPSTVEGIDLYWDDLRRAETAYINDWTYKFDEV